MNHLCQWVKAEMSRIGHPHWWKEVRASGRVSMGEHIMRECNLNDEVQHYAIWQVVAFRLPLAQQDALGWWDAPPWLSRLCPQDFMPITDASTLWILGP